ncbi:hypothetical protein, partial [Spiroplasma poulsonii]|uniref:hypothetical protein n=1 Tax=Spiroplasma poulsonii TaxID=2138 RepID=UPI001A8DB938
NNWYSVLFNFEGYKIINFYNSSNEIRVDFNNLTLMKDNDNNLYLYKKWGSPLPIQILILQFIVEMELMNQLYQL